LDTLLQSLLDVIHPGQDKICILDLGHFPETAALVKTAAQLSGAPPSDVPMSDVPLKIISTKDVPLQWFLDAAKNLKNAGISTVHIIGPGWWVSNSPAPVASDPTPDSSPISGLAPIADGSALFAVRIIDHIACHHPNPLTGTDQARRGEAFLNMLDAYDKQLSRDEPAVSAGNLSGNVLRDVDLPEVVLWHTLSASNLSDEELEQARSAECQVASPIIAPWTVALRYEGIRLSASVICGITSPKPAH
jgi:hypothetical protein